MNARKRAEQFSIDSIVTRYEELYEQLTSRSHSAAAHSPVLRLGHCFALSAPEHIARLSDYCDMWRVLHRFCHQIVSYKSLITSSDDSVEEVATSSFLGRRHLPIRR